MFNHTAKAMQTDETDFREVVCNNPDGIVIIGKDRTVQFVNPAAEAFLCAKAEQLTGCVFPLPLEEGKVTQVDIFGHSKEPGVAQMRVVETKFNGRDAYLVSLSDITEHCLTEEKLSKEIEKLQECNRLKDEFVTVASHELGTPLSIITGAVKLILDEMPGRIKPEQRDILATAMENAQRLARIVESLLTVSKIESGKLDLQIATVDICELIRHTVSDYENIARQKGICLDCEVPPNKVDLCLDPDKTRQILINLISNSIKFTPEGGWVKVICSKADEEISISVGDCGVGIAEKDIPKLFDKFARFGRKAGPGEKGTGLGLTIVKKLVELQGGRIDVESEPGKGTIFTVFLPLTVKPITKELTNQTDGLVENIIANN